MENTQLLFLLAFGLVIAFFALMFVITRRGDAQQLKLQHEAMHHSVSRFRLSKMLAYVGIKLEDYVTNLPREEINRHVSRCITCPEIPSCDYCFGEGQCAGDLKFCPNYDALVAYRRVMPALKD